MSSSIAVLAAHPDDEVIGAAGLLLRCRRAAVVHLTDGAPRDPRLRPGSADRAAWARLRRAEAAAAAAEAGLSDAQVLQLGGVDQEAAEAVAPLARALAAALRALEADVLVTHALEGGHPDHDAAAVVARAAGALLEREHRRPPRLLEMACYHLRDGRLVTGAFLGAPGALVPLAPAERAAKRRMLDHHASQRAVLAPFGVAAERYRRAGPLALERPHPGPLRYEALGWTTFERFRASVLRGLEALDLPCAFAGEEASTPRAGVAPGPDRAGP